MPFAVSIATSGAGAVSVRKSPCSWSGSSSFPVTWTKLGLPLVASSVSSIAVGGVLAKTVSETVAVSVPPVPSEIV